MWASFRKGSNRKLPDRAAKLSALRRRALFLLRAVGLIAGATAAAAGALYGLRVGLSYATTSPTFAVDDIQVTGDVGGSAPLSADQLRAASGLQLGGNIFRTKLGAAQDRLGSNPWVRTVSVTRELPRRVHVSVEQRRAAAYIELSGLYLVDDRGQVFKRATPEDAFDLPTITGLSRKDFIAGRADLRENLSAALALIAPPAGTAPAWEPAELSEIHFDGDLGLSLELGPLPTAVQLGFPPYAEKLERLRRARNELSRRQLRASALYLDDSRQPDHVGMALAGVDPVANTTSP